MLAVLLLSWAARAMGAPPRPATDDEIHLFLTHMRNSFEDIHDVSMRFHAVDPAISGTIALALVWEEGLLKSGSVESNDTGSEEEAVAMLDAIRNWRVEGLEGPCRMVVPIRIRLVGSDEPDFAEKGILTGWVRDANGGAIHPALVTFRGAAEDTAGGASHPRPARTNREGVYIRSLIPPGVWEVICTADGYEPMARRDVRFSAGEHRTVTFILEAKEGSGTPTD